MALPDSPGSLPGIETGSCHFQSLSFSFSPCLFYTNPTNLLLFFLNIPQPYPPICSWLLLAPILNSNSVFLLSFLLLQVFSSEMIFSYLIALPHHSVEQPAPAPLPYPQAEVEVSVATLTCVPARIAAPAFMALTVSLAGRMLCSRLSSYSCCLS